MHGGFVWVSGCGGIRRPSRAYPPAVEVGQTATETQIAPDPSAQASNASESRCNKWECPLSFGEIQWLVHSANSIATTLELLCRRTPKWHRILVLGHCRLGRLFGVNCKCSLTSRITEP